jgi:hypothetical protein
MALTPIPLSEADLMVLSAQILTNFDESVVLDQFTNQRYTGEIAGKSSQVKIVGLEDVTIGEYLPGQTDVVPEALTDSSIVLTTDQSDFYAFEVDDVVAAAGAGGYLSAAASRAGQQLAYKVDEHIAATVEAEATNSLTDVDLSVAGSAFEALVTARAMLFDTANSYMAAVTPEFAVNLVLDPRFQKQGGYSADFMKAEVGMAANIRVIQSAAVTTPWVQSTPEAVGLAHLIKEAESYRPADAFSNAVKGLQVYGAAVIRDKAIVKMPVVTTP